MARDQHPEELFHCVPKCFELPRFRGLTPLEAEIIQNGLFRRSGLRHAHNAVLAFDEAIGPAVQHSPEGIDRDGWTRSDDVWNRARVSGSPIYMLMDRDTIREWLPRDLGLYYTLLRDYSQFSDDIDLLVSLEFQAAWEYGVETGVLIRYDLLPDPEQKSNG